MHSIIFHIAGIAMLEICFYFLYIGPIESKMFQKSIILLINQPLTENNQLDPLYKIISNTSKFKTINNELFHESQVGKVAREHTNNELFLKSMYYWCGLVMFGGIVYGCTQKYNRYVKFKGNNRNLIVMDDIESNVAYPDRKYSNDLTPYIIEPQYNNNNHRICKKVIYYVSFSGCVLLFEYVFFKYIVLFYSPLSIREFRYIIVQYILEE